MAKEHGHDKGPAAEGRACPARAADCAPARPLRPCLAVGRVRAVRPRADAYAELCLSNTADTSGIRRKKGSTRPPAPARGVEERAKPAPGEEPFPAVYHTPGEKYSFFCRGGEERRGEEEEDGSRAWWSWTRTVWWAGRMRRQNSRRRDDPGGSSNDSFKCLCSTGTRSIGS